MTTDTGTAIGDENVKRKGAGRGAAKNALTTPLAPRPVASPPKVAKSLSKASAVIRLLSRSKGATGPEIASATEWQPHSVRAYLSGLRKKGNHISREPRNDGEQSYRLKYAATTIITSPGPSGGDARDEGSGTASAEDIGPGTDDTNLGSPGAAAAAVA